MKIARVISFYAYRWAVCWKQYSASFTVLLHRWPLRVKPRHRTAMIDVAKRIESRYTKGDAMEINLQISRIRFADQRCRLRSYPATSWSFVMQVVIADGMHTFFNCFRYLDAYYIRVLIAIVSLNARASVESTRVNQICSCIAQSFTNTNTLSTISHLLYRWKAWFNGLECHLYYILCKEPNWADLDRSRTLFK